MGTVGNVQPPSQVTIPPGGTTGQVLAKAGTPDYSASWQSLAAASGVGPEWVVPVSTTNWYDQRFAPVSLPGSYFYPTGQSTYYVAVYVPFTGTIGRVALFGNLPSTVTITCGISSPSAAFGGAPGTLLASNSVLASGSTTFNGPTLSCAVTPGWYWLSAGSPSWSSGTVYYGPYATNVRSPMPPSFSGPSSTVTYYPACQDNSSATPVNGGPSSPVWLSSASPLIAFTRTA